MKRALTSEEVEIRSAKLRAWWEWMEGRYSDLLSRQETASAPSGFAEPRVIRRGGKEWVEIDPYALDVNVGVQVNWSPSSLKAHLAEISYSQLRSLERNESIRAGKEVPLGRALGQVMAVQGGPQGYWKIVKGLRILNEVRPSLYSSLPSSEALRAAVILMHRCVGGRFPNPPSDV